MAAGTGPVAIDAERASGHRYGQRAFLVQLRREGAGTALVDPVALPDLAPSAPRSGTPSGSSTPRPRTCPAWPRWASSRPGCSTPSSAAGWPGSPGSAWPRWSSSSSGSRWPRSTRRSTGPPARCPSPGCATRRSTSRCSSTCATPSPRSSSARASSEWAREEFAAVAATPPPAPRVDPWRRTSGMHRVRSRRGLAAVRELWLARDEIARERDLSPGRVLPDSAIVEAAVGAAGDAGGARRPARLQRPRRAALPAAVGRGRGAGPGARRTASCRRRTCPRTARRRPASGATATRRPRRASPPPGGGDVARRRAAAAGREPAVAGHRPPAGLEPRRSRSRSRASPTRCSGYGARRWQVSLTVTPLTTGLLTAEVPPS